MVVAIKMAEKTLADFTSSDVNADVATEKAIDSGQSWFQRSDICPVKNTRYLNFERH